MVDARRVAAHVEPVVVERLLERLHLRLGDRHLRLAQLGEILGSDIRREQADDDDHDQQFQQRKTSFVPYSVHER